MNAKWQACQADAGQAWVTFLQTQESSSGQAGEPALTSYGALREEGQSQDSPTLVLVSS